MTNQDHLGVAQKTGERFHANAITEMSKATLFEKDLQVRTYKTGYFAF